MGFYVHRFVLDLVALGEGHLPRSLGSAIRGAFGNGLRRLVCVEPGTECSACPHRSICNYVSIFTPCDAESGNAIPTGFIWQAERRTQNRISTGDTLPIGLTLIGSAVRYLPYVVYVFRGLHRRGLGKERIPFQLAKVANLSPAGDACTLYEDGSETIGAPCYPMPALAEDAGQAAPVPHGAERVRLEFETPCRLTIGEQLIIPTTFEAVMRGLFRRLSDLDRYYGEGTLSLDYPAWLRLAAEAHTLRSDLRWVDIARYSNRQQCKMKMGGFVGRIEFEGPLGPFVPFLRAGEYTHLGKNAGFGNGRYTMHVLPRQESTQAGDRAEDEFRASQISE
ncbi:CRISPR system precrRNA processing endoribonuclease RAMP protein Cas6 [bacterium]|nr:CRISPR system precrRNA processing endoribonuclease RAMP protein Cas6 [bacterium]